MSSVSRSKRVDRNRLAKTYPFLHRIPKYTFMNDPSISYETGTVCFEGLDTVTYTFDTVYTNTPTVVVSAISDDINVWISNVSTASVTFNSSVLTSACVSFQIVSIGE